MEAAEYVMATFFQTFVVDETSIVSGYWPTGAELDVRPMLKILARKCICALPLMQNDHKLVFCQWTPSFPLVAGPLGIMEPDPTVLVDPNILLVPVVAFDRQGNRLGYGSGYYDRAITYLRKTQKVLCIGVAYACQEVSDVPVYSHDQPLDYILTEKEIIKCDSAKTERPIL